MGVDKASRDLGVLGLGVRVLTVGHHQLEGVFIGGDGAAPPPRYFNPSMGKQSMQYLRDPTPWLPAQGKFVLNLRSPRLAGLQAPEIAARVSQEES